MFSKVFSSRSSAGKSERFDCNDELRERKQQNGLIQSSSRIRVLLADLTDGMCLASPVVSCHGTVLAEAGIYVTPLMIRLLRGYAQHTPVREPLEVILDTAPTAQPKST